MSMLSRISGTTGHVSFYAKNRRRRFSPAFLVPRYYSAIVTEDDPPWHPVERWHQVLWLGFSFNLFVPIS